jgi:hypothetical protein
LTNYNGAAANNKDGLDGFVLWHSAANVSAGELFVRPSERISTKPLPAGNEFYTFDAGAAKDLTSSTAKYHTPLVQAKKNQKR